MAFGVFLTLSDGNFIVVAQSYSCTSVQVKPGGRRGAQLAFLSLSLSLSVRSSLLLTSTCPGQVKSDSENELRDERAER